MRTTGLGNATMNSLLSSQSMLKRVSQMGAEHNKLSKGSNVLKSEIKLDKGRGLDPKEKEKKLGEMGETITKLQGQLTENLDTLAKKIANDNEKITKEEQAKADAEKSAEEKAVTEGTKEGTTSVQTPTQSSSVQGDVILTGNTATKTEVVVAENIPSPDIAGFVKGVPQPHIDVQV